MNPKLTKFIEDNPTMGLIGFAWACFWRINLIVFAVYVGFFMLATFISILV